MHVLARNSLAFAALLLLVGCGEREPSRDFAQQTESLTAPAQVSSFVVLASAHATFMDRTAVTGGHVGVAPGSGDSVTASYDTKIALGKSTLGQRTVLRDRAAVGDLFANTVVGPLGTYTSLSPYAAPPAHPPIISFTAGTTPVSVNTPMTLAAGNYGVVTVNSTLTLSGGTYQLQSITLGTNAVIQASTTSIVRVQGKITGGNNVRISPTGVQGAGTLRLSVAGATDATGGIVLGTDAKVTALVLSRASVSFGDRLTASGAFASSNFSTGIDSKIAFALGFECNADSACNDSNPCTTDTCVDAKCLHTALANGTACPDDGSVCTTDQCSAGVCAHPALVDGTACTDDSNVCTTDRCTAGACTHPAVPNGTACADDGNVCTSDQCTAGACAHPALPNGTACPADSNVCTSDQCVSGACSHPALADGTACPDDGNICTSDHCTAGACGHPALADGTICSDDGNACTFDTCTSGSCSHASAPDGSVCPDDGNVCTIDHCAFGVCNHDGPATCDAALVIPSVTCVATDPEGNHFAIFGYTSTASTPVEIAVGPNNQFSPTSSVPPPTIFQPGTHTQVLSVHFSGASVTWFAGGGNATATTSSPSCGALVDIDDEHNDPVDKLAPVVGGHPLEESAELVETSSNGFPLEHIVPDPLDPLVPLALIDGDRGDRAVEVVVVNATSEKLYFNSGAVRGDVTTQPPAVILAGQYGTMESRDGGFAVGTDGELNYWIGIEGGPRVHMEWSNPDVGNNEYVHITDSADFVVDRIGGENALASVFFIVRPSSQPERSCVSGNMQWILDSLGQMQPELRGLTEETPAGLLTPIKRGVPLGVSLGLMTWGTTGCRTDRVIGTVKHRAWSTDGFYTFDVVLEEFNGAFLVSTNKAVRIEVDPLDPNDWDGENPAHQAIKNAGGLDSVHIDTRILFSGPIRIDHGNFLEVHPDVAMQPAPTCDSPNPPLICNPVLKNVFTLDSGFSGDVATKVIGRADHRACFITTVDGSLVSPALSIAQGEASTKIDETTGDWVLTATSGTPLKNMKVRARCVAADNISPEYRWSGDAAVYMDEVSADHTCYLTGIGGDWSNTGSTVLIENTLSPARLSGTVTAPGDFGLHATARCIDVQEELFDYTYTLNAGEAGRVPMREIEAGCFFREIHAGFPGGLFDVGGRLDMLPETVGGVLSWTAGIGGDAQGARIQCNRLPQ